METANFENTENTADRSSRHINLPTYYCIFPAIVTQIKEKVLPKVYESIPRKCILNTIYLHKLINSLSQITFHLEVNY